ncbi:MAG: phospholipid scramblase 1 [Piccolia ochrophora]|nr:MAG: phospholipid scramblase 1 [Piccolia ochrophora]
MDKLLISFWVFDLIFLATGTLMVVVAVMVKKEMAAGMTIDNVASGLLLNHAPLTGALANGGVVFATFLLSIPGVMLPLTRNWLRLHGWAVVACAIFTLVVGLDVWFKTLKTRSMLSTMWGEHSAVTQSLLQQRFDCCGYLDAATPPFQKDSVCPNALVAAQKLGCVGAFSDFANTYLNRVFTASFGIVTLDVILLLHVAMLLKERREKHRYRHIDSKTGLRAI